jgi:hypothetical protein
MFPRGTWDGYEFTDTGEQPRPQKVTRTFLGTVYTPKTNPWKVLHEYSGCDPQWHFDWEKTIPRYGCSCRANYDQYKAANPPDFSSPNAYWLWGHNLHNWVNRKLGKPELTVDEALAIWRREYGVETQQTATQCNRDQLRVDEE